MPYFVLYSKPGCHLCEGLQEKLHQVIPIISSQLGLGSGQALGLEIRDITSQPDWWQAYQFEIPVLFWVTDEQTPPTLIPRPSPRCSVSQLQKLLEPYCRA